MSGDRGDHRRVVGHLHVLEQALLTFEQPTVVDVQLHSCRPGIGAALGGAEVALESLAESGASHGLVERLGGAGKSGLVLLSSAEFGEIGGQTEALAAASAVRRS